LEGKCCCAKSAVCNAASNIKIARDFMSISFLTGL
jgi:hypothetical protein